MTQKSTNRRGDMLTLRITTELREAVQRRANADERTISWYVLRLLQDHVDSTPEPKPKIRKSGFLGS